MNGWEVAGFWFLIFVLAVELPEPVYNTTLSLSYSVGKYGHYRKTHPLGPLA